MTQGFDQQEDTAAQAFTRSQPAPQHGRKADTPAKQVCERRAVLPRLPH